MYVIGSRESKLVRNKPFFTNGGDSNLEISLNELVFRTELSKSSLFRFVSWTALLSGFAILARTRTSIVDIPGLLNVYSNDVSLVDP